ncbi:hypothetical protein AAFF_G00105980 [Aldrovandia affinis]|uniref:Uncharacterized protein n=1 Tax=Aldrovandia affinis TaxID=143900 RepID=A0AAD7T3Y6_9TELE|nr:hypothetical protein AAFF_G00105980 [Aldrovandia affinis]
MGNRKHFGRPTCTSRWLSDGTSITRFSSPITPHAAHLPQPSLHGCSLPIKAYTGPKMRSLTPPSQTGQPSSRQNCTTRRRRRQSQPIQAPPGYVPSLCPALEEAQGLG